MRRITTCAAFGVTLAVGFFAASLPAFADTEQTFAFTGAPQQMTVPTGICLATLTVFGAQGADGQYGVAGGRGGQVDATVAVTAGDTLTIDVGGQGGTPEDARTAGYGGGGQGGGYVVGGQLSGIQAGGGGGRTTVSLAGTTIVVAGGGGGGAGTFFSTDPTGGAGGLLGEDGVAVAGPDEGAPGLSGGNGGAGGVNAGTMLNGDDGSPSVGPVGGRGGDTTGDPHGGAGGGGGGGYVGGGGGAASPTDHNSGAGGGGGSGFGPVGAQFQDGVRLGDGEVIVDLFECATVPVPTPSPTTTTPAPALPPGPPAIALPAQEPTASLVSDHDLAQTGSPWVAITGLLVTLSLVIGVSLTVIRRRRAG